MARDGICKSFGIYPQLMKQMDLKITVRATILLVSKTHFIKNHQAVPANFLVARRIHDDGTVLRDFAMVNTCICWTVETDDLLLTLMQAIPLNG